MIENQPRLIEPLLKAADVARTLNVSRTEAYRLMKSDIPSVRFGGSTIRVRSCDLEQYITDRLQKVGSSG